MERDTGAGNVVVRRVGSLLRVLFDGPWPYKDPRAGKSKKKPGRKLGQKGKPKPKKEYLPVFQPAMKEWNLVVTKQSPLWLRNIAMQLQ